jgi:anti-repressor protein
MNTITPFSFEGTPVRTVQIDGETQFVAADVCEALDIQNVAQAVTRLDDDERSMFNIGRQGDAHVINESGLYRLILTSRKPEAKRFRKWVTGEVLPTIRKTGSYGKLAVPTALSTMDILTLAIESEKGRLAAVEQLAIASPKADALDRIAGADGSMCITDTAKAIKVQPKWLFSWMHANDWIYKRAGNSKWVAHQSRLKSAHLDCEYVTIFRPDGTEKNIANVLVTAKGLAKLAELFGAEVQR